MDEHRREIERLAASGDPEANIRLKVARCHSGECCAHNNKWPIPSDEALGARVWIDETNCAINFAFEPDRIEADMMLRIDGDTKQVQGALAWLNKLFTEPYPPTGKIKMPPTIGEQLI